MGRRRGGGRSANSGGGLFAKRAAPTASARPQQRRQAPPPPQKQAPPPPAPTPQPSAPPAQSGGMLSGLGGMVAQGMALGTGSAIAHQAVNRVMGGGGSSHAPAEQQPQEYQPTPTLQQGYEQSNDVCAINQQDLYRCLQEHSGDAGACQFYFDALKQCQENTRASSF